MIKNSYMKILLVDDDLLSLESLKSFLSSEGYNIKVQSEIESTWKACERQEIDIIASDYVLKNADGLDLLYHAKLMNPDTIKIKFCIFEILNNKF